MVAEAGGNLSGVAKLQERYRILAKLGSGGMADVFLGVQLGEESFQRLVVIKRIHSLWLENQNAMRMFIAEARTIASLSHPHIVKIFDLARLGRDICIAMEYVNGENLDFIRRAAFKAQTRMPLPIICKIIVEACEALHYAHTATTPAGKQLELVHRDVGPHNLMLDNNGYLKVIDFGIAKSSARSDLTSPGMIKGKFSYLAPDLFKYEKIDGRADLYALGLVFYELITLRRSFSFKKDVAVAEVIKRVANEQLPKPSIILPEIPKRIDTIISLATHKDRDRRYQSCEEMAADIRDFADHHSGLANNKEVESWFQDALRERIAKRREFEIRALEKAQALLKKEAEESSPAMQSSDQFQVSNIGPITGVSNFQVHRGTTGLTTERQTNPYMLLMMVFIMFVGGVSIVYFLFYKDGDTDQLALTQNTTEPQQEVRPTQKTIKKNLWVGSIPAEAEIFVDGIQVGSTNQFGTELEIAPDKKHWVEVRKEGFEPFRRQIMGERFAQRKLEVKLVALAVPPTQTEEEPPPQPQVAAVPTQVVKKDHTNTPSRPNKKKPPRKKTRSAPEKTSEARAKRSEPIKVAKLTDRESAPEIEISQPEQESSPKPPSNNPRNTTRAFRPVNQPKPADKKVAMIAPRVQWYSGDGSWSGPQVANQGCTRCHNGSQNPRIDYVTKTRRQWNRFFRRHRHNKHVKLKYHFSKDELKRVLAYIMSQIQEEKKSGIAGVK